MDEGSITPGQGLRRFFFAHENRAMSSGEKMSGERRRKIENEIEHRESGISGEAGIAKRARPSWTRASKTQVPAGREPGKAHKQRGKSHL
jgi:hypothetical protein